MNAAMEKVILFAVGSFNPITIMHLRMFELARDYFNRSSRVSVIGGVLSPVNDKYPKQGLAAGHHRIAMTTLGGNTSQQQWIKVSPWEALETSDWTRTCVSMDYHQNQINQYLDGTLLTTHSWMPETHHLKRPDSSAPSPVKLKLLCGADVLETFNVPDLWSSEHMEIIARDYGFVVITRSGQDPEASIQRNPILKNYKSNIFIVKEKIKNEISSTQIRDAIKNGESIRYLVPDSVVDYIEQNQLYQLK